MKRYKYRESIINSFSHKDIIIGNFYDEIKIHINKKCLISYYEEYGNGISIFQEGIFNIKRGQIFISNGKSFITISNKKIKNIIYKKDNSFFIDIYLENGLYATIDFD